MDIHLRWLAIITLTILSTTGCVHERVYRCDDGAGLVLSGRNDCKSCPPGGTCGPGCNLPAVRPLATLKRKFTCGKGCGDIYRDEWCSDRPDRCDPCDECSSDFIGERYCCPPGLTRTVGSVFFGGRNRHGCVDGTCGDADTLDESAEYAATEDAYYPTQPQAIPQKSLPKANPLPAPKLEAVEPESNIEPESNVEPAPLDEPPTLPSTTRDASRPIRPSTRSASLRK